jgi:hypothetical protein
MQEGQLLMTQAERDRLVTLKKAKKKVITQRDGAEELGLSIRQVKRLLYGLKKRGDKAVAPKLRGKPSNRRMEESTGTGKQREKCAAHTSTSVAIGSWHIEPIEKVAAHVARSVFSHLRHQRVVRRPRCGRNRYRR